MMMKVAYKIYKTRPAGPCPGVLPLQGELEGVCEGKYPNLNKASY